MSDAVETVENENVNADVEVIDAEEEVQVVASGIATGLTKGISFAPIDTTLSPEERAPLVRDMLQRSHQAECSDSSCAERHRYLVRNHIVAETLQGRQEGGQIRIRVRDWPVGLQ